MDPSQRYAEGAWLGGMVRTAYRNPAVGPLFADLIEGSDASFLLGVAPADRYRVRIAVGDPEVERGPLDVRVNGVMAAEKLAVAAGSFADVMADVPARDGKIRIDFRSARCGTLSVAGIALYAPTGSPGTGSNPLRPLFAPEASPGTQPPFRSRDAAALAAARDRLRAYCDYLLANRPEEGCFAYSGNWYESSFPARALLAGARMLGEPRYASEVFECLDRFVEEQHEDGQWGAQYFGERGCELARQTVLRAESANLADVGTLALCLAVGAAQADPARRERYLQSARRYADRIVLPNQTPAGAFPNLRFEGREYRYPYTVATGVQAAHLSALYAVTGDVRYRTAAEKAGLFLAKACREDGKVAFFDYRHDTPVALDPSDLGNFFYMMEGILWSHQVARPQVAQILRDALDRYFLGPRGLQTWMSQDVWWYPTKPWEESKRAGLLYLLALYRESTQESERVDPFLGRILGAFLDTAYTDQYAIQGDPSAPRGRFALTSTGMAGLGMASLVRAAAVLPASAGAADR
jgi:hypothetical protein